MELEALQAAAAEIESLGAMLVTIAPHDPSYSLALVKDKKLAFEMLSDPKNQIAEQFGIAFKLPEDLKQIYQKFGIDLEKFNGDDSWTLPMPARYIIDRQGVIQYRATDPDYTVRPEPEETLEALKTLNLKG